MLLFHNFNFLLVSLLVVATASLHVTQGQVVDKKKLCETATNCNECLQKDASCAWCSEQNSTLRYRCSLKTTIELECPGYTQYNASSLVATKNLPFSRVNGSEVQLSPQEITLHLKINEPKKFNVTFRKAYDYPVDLYYLMDNSHSMKDDLVKLKELGRSLVLNIRKNVTNNLKIGFGTFVDKVMLPFTSTLPSQLANPCISTNDTCVSPFSFKHRQSISDDYTSFERSVNKTQISGNVDPPEGVFDALLQIAKCPTTMAWRNDSTHLVVVTTDAPFHSALDGKIAGLLEPFDMNCHMEQSINEDNVWEYTKNTEFDYPSIGQLKLALAEARIQPIFAVTDNRKALYQDLQKLIPSAFVDTLTEDSSNIISIIETAYNALKETLEMTVDQNIPSNIELTYRVLCPNTTVWKDNILRCDNVKLDGKDTIYEFTATAKSCPVTDGNPSYPPVMMTSSSLTESVAIKFNVLCSCGCSMSATGDLDTFCSSKGSVVCGICQCNPGYAGNQCQCSNTDSSTNQDRCKVGGVGDICSNNGQCECGKCICDDFYNGEFCQCSDKGCSSTPVQNGGGGICGGNDLVTGLEKGTCRNCNGDKRCECKNGWTLNDKDNTCSCHTKLCQVNATSSVCNDNGKCTCTTCQCDLAKDGKPLYSGTYCDNCVHPDCTPITGECKTDKTLEPCAQCQIDLQIQKKTTGCELVCEGAGLNVRPVPQLYDCASNACQDECKVQCADIDSTVTSSICKPPQATTTSCVVEYKAMWNSKLNAYELWIKDFNEQTDCQTPLPSWLLITIIVAVILTVGACLLVAWKVFVFLRDRREWQEFQKDKEDANWAAGENPLYKEDVKMKFTNPVFGIPNPSKVTTDEDPDQPQSSGL